MCDVLLWLRADCQLVGKSSVRAGGRAGEGQHPNTHTIHAGGTTDDESQNAFSRTLAEVRIDLIYALSELCKILDEKEPNV